MRILAIRGKNLASLEGEFEVDFTVDPLKSAGIFAITGSTGSGKSTLLDTICLALFNDTPRINRASDNADIADVKELTIKQKDSRNILRRGTADGYAEVDFVALSGDKYRARWGVRRSRDKIDGSLQNATYKVSNLTSNSELQGGKTELLQLVRELIGLTFDQFTRAVLLAQGDFATFLKAAPKEKAELLEKLTGTDIYSRISSKIYENTKQAETELSIITERINDVELLSDDKKVELTTEKETIIKEIKLLDTEIKTFTDKLKWLQINEQLIKNIAIAQSELEKSKTAIEEAKPRFDYLTRTESVQQIRDTFRQLENDKKQLVSTETSFIKQESLGKINNEAATKAKENFLAIELCQKQITAEWQIIEPQLKEARKLDIQIESTNKNLTDIDKEVTQTTQLKSVCEKSIVVANEKTQAIQQSQQRIAKWFEENNQYSAIIPRVELIVSYIADAGSTSKQGVQNKKLLVQIKEALAKEEQKLITQQTEAKRLNDILPAEIAILRAKLKENEPCPVCGSTHHPISGVTVESLEEDELNKAKVLVEQEINRLTESISNRKGELIRLQSLIDEYKVQHEATFAKLTEAMISLTNWKVKYEDKTLSGELKSIVAQWQANLAEQTETSERFSTLNQEIKIAKDRLVELTTTLKEKQEKQNAISIELKELNNKRKELLSGKKADDVEKSHVDKQQKISTQFTQATELQNNLIAKGEKISGVITQLTENKLRLQSRIDELNATVSQWIEARKDGLSVEDLSELLSKDNSWLIAERESLDKLRNNILSVKTTLTERLRVAEEHQKAEVKPDENEIQELIVNTLNEKSMLADSKRERKTEIDVLFVNHEKGKAKIKLFEKELAEKNATTENWRKLNELFGSADGAKFKVLAQGYTLDVLLGYANNHLKDISQRYLLERVSSDSLSLQVVDLDMLSEIRSVHSLSGGESFLISLALALGLSSLSSNRMRIESLFIDEGFGSLDADTLRVAMDALERLQTQGRKIGVISHVAEMTERITTQIKVIKSSNGRSKIEIV
ncbi:MAG: SbcC/MukB-like Walker B domain-containing protein [Akkermansia sp.]